jgi:hemolysin activation/secretion protein
MLTVGCIAVAALVLPAAHSAGWGAYSITGGHRVGSPRGRAARLVANQSDGPVYAIRQVEITGPISMYSKDAIRPYTDGLVGSAISSRQLENARQEVLSALRGGMLYCRVDLDVDASVGVARFRVTPGRIVAVTFDRDIGVAGDQIASALQPFVNEAPLDVWGLQEAFNNARWVAAWQFGVSLEFTAQAPASRPTDVTLVVHPSEPGVLQEWLSPMRRLLAAFIDWISLQTGISA